MDRVIVCRSGSGRSQADGLEGIGVDIPRRDRHCKREDVPKTALPFGRKFAIAGCISREKVGYGRGANAPKRKSGELHDPLCPALFAAIGASPMSRRKRAASSQAGFWTDRQSILIIWGSGWLSEFSRLWLLYLCGVTALETVGFTSEARRFFYRCLASD